MFEKIKEAFETYSQSSNLHKDPTLRSIHVKMGPSYLANEIIELLKGLKYKEIRYNDIYNEIFTSKAGFEVTIHLLSGGSGSTTIEVSVFSPANKGKTRRALRFLLNHFKESFKTYISHE